MNEILCHVYANSACNKLVVNLLSWVLKFIDFVSILLSKMDMTKSLVLMCI